VYRLHSPGIKLHTLAHRGDSVNSFWNSHPVERIYIRYVDLHSTNTTTSCAPFVTLRHVSLAYAGRHHVAATKS
jgi:hypothetical protein